MINLLPSFMARKNNLNRLGAIVMLFARANVSMLLNSASRVLLPGFGMLLMSCGINEFMFVYKSRSCLNTSLSSAISTATLAWLVRLLHFRCKITKIVPTLIVFYSSVVPLSLIEYKRRSWDCAIGLQKKRAVSYLAPQNNQCWEVTF